MSRLFEWTVIGAGPAGIASVGKLLDAGVPSADTAWIDPQFKVGDFGTAWRYVGSNTPVEFFIKFYQACAAFRYSSPDRPPFIIDKIQPNKNCPLMLAAQPLNWITQHLCEHVHSIKSKVERLVPIKKIWQLNLSSGETLRTKKVILALGAEAKGLDFENITTIALQDALNSNRLKKMIQTNDVVAVFGSSQSSKSVIENLSKLTIKKTLLFYRSESSLTRHIPDDLLQHVQPLEITSLNFLNEIPQCTKIIYAMGFERRHVPITGLPAQYAYDKKTGEIAPGVYGLGIAFPEIKPYELGQVEYRVSAIWPFMKRLDKLLPSWLGTASPPSGMKLNDAENEFHEEIKELLL